MRRGGNTRGDPPLSPLHQLPYLIDGKVKLTQSNAILPYIARTHNMCECRNGHGGVPFTGWGGSDVSDPPNTQAVRRRRRSSAWTCWRTTSWISA